MKLRRHRVLLMVAAITGSVTIYGCGGEGGSDRTNLDRTDADRAAEQAKEQVETRVDAVDRALAAAVRAATAASGAAAAAKAASDAAASAAEAATKEGLNIETVMAKSGEAASHSAEARRQSDRAAAAAADALAQAERHVAAKEHRDAAVASANAARISADIAAASAIEAARSLVTAQELPADPTPFNQADLDKAAADAQAQAEMRAAAKAEAELRADAIAKAMAAAGRAASEAKKADDAAKAAAAAAAAAAATTEGLSVEDATKQSAEADKQSRMAMAAYEAAKAAAAAAAAEAARHMDAEEHSDAAMAAANAAKASAEMAATSAMAAAQSLATAKSFKESHDVADNMAQATKYDHPAEAAAAAGVQAEMAKQQAAVAKYEADKALAQVMMAKDATTGKAAEDARKAAMTARNAVKEASGAADAAADAAEAIMYDHPAVAAAKTRARNYANAAMASLGKASMYFDYTAGYADARKAHDQADAGKDDIDKHADLKGRVKWIVDAEAADGRLEDEAKKARDAAESLETETVQSRIEAHQGDIADALGKAKIERAKAMEDLAAAMKVYDAAKPWSENAMGITDANKASGNTLRHPNNRIALDNSDTHVFAAWQKLSARGTHDIVRNTLGVVSLSGRFSPTGTTETRYMYQMYHNNRWTTDAGTAWTYEYVSFGLWARAAARTAAAFEAPSGSTIVSSNVTDVVAERNSFVFAKMSNLTANLPNAGTASFEGSHVSHIMVDTGSNGQSTSTTAVADALVAGSGPGTAQSFVEGKAHANIDFASNTANLMLNSDHVSPSTNNTGKIFYDVTGIKLNGNILSGGTYSGRDDEQADAHRKDLSHAEVDDVFTNDPLYLTEGVSGSTTALSNAIQASTLKLHGGVFGAKPVEIAGTVNVEWTKAHSAAEADVSRARNAKVSILTAFGARNGQFGTGVVVVPTPGGGFPPPPNCLRNNRGELLTPRRPPGCTP